MSIASLFKGRANPRDRFERIIRPNIDTLYRFAFRLCHTRDDAEELVQLLLTRLFPKIEQLESIEKLSPWLCRSLYNLYIDHFRSAIRESNLFDHETDGDQCMSDIATPLENASNDDLRKKIDDAMQQLNEDQRVVVLLYYGEGYTLIELSEILQVPLGTLKSRLSRARNILIQTFTVEPFEDFDRDLHRERRIL